jgi:antitoxin (DNA-binding transcriptional repressor) of toxin-antitoxin stability system
MSAVSVREFSYNPSAMFSRVEQGETIEVTRHGKVIAVLLPGSGTLGRYSSLVAKGGSCASSWGNGGISLSAQAPSASWRPRGHSTAPATFRRSWTVSRTTSRRFC